MKFTLQLNQATRDRLNRLATVRGTTMTDVVRNALAVYEVIHDADELVVMKDGEAKTVVVP